MNSGLALMFLAFDLFTLKVVDSSGLYALQVQSEVLFVNVIGINSYQRLNIYIHYLLLNVISWQFRSSLRSVTRTGGARISKQSTGKGD